MAQKDGHEENARNMAANTGVPVDAAATFKVHLLDIGTGQSHRYGDCILCQFGEVSVLIDGGHSNDAEIILPQLQMLLDQNQAVHVSEPVSSAGAAAGPVVSVQSNGYAPEIYAKLPPNATRFNFSVELAPTSPSGVNPQARRRNRT